MHPGFDLGQVPHYAARREEKALGKRSATFELVESVSGTIWRRLLRRMVRRRSAWSVGAANDSSLIALASHVRRG